MDSFLKTSRARSRPSCATSSPASNRTSSVARTSAAYYFLALLASFGKPDGDCLLSALHRFVASAALESTLLAFMHRLLDLLRGTAWIFPGHLVCLLFPLTLAPSTLSAFHGCMIDWKLAQPREGIAAGLVSPSASVWPRGPD